MRKILCDTKIGTYLSYVKCCFLLLVDSPDVQLSGHNKSTYHTAMDVHNSKMQRCVSILIRLIDQVILLQQTLDRVILLQIRNVFNHVN